MHALSKPLSPDKLNFLGRMTLFTIIQYKIDALIAFKICASFSSRIAQASSMDVTIGWIMRCFDHFFDSSSSKPISLY